MARQRKFIKGPPFRDVHALIERILDRDYVIWRDKPMHPGWMHSQQLGTLVSIVRRGDVYVAMPNPDYKPPKPKGEACT